MRNIICILLILTGLQIFAQRERTNNSTYPVGYFRAPLDIPLYLSGSFAELRSNHFHSGIDIKTQLKEGFKVYASAEGYVSRIKISHWGFGKALYITHPNGYTTVYAHLKKFNDRIEAYIKKQQYKKESYEIQLFPASDVLRISKDEIVAISGNTGGSLGPHLHFEIRDSSTEKIINPLLFGINIKDSKKPVINRLYGYTLSDDSHIDGVGFQKQLSIKTLSNGSMLADTIQAFGTIGFGINTYDQHDGALNKNGLYSLEVYSNGTKIHDFKAVTFAFSETKYINLLIDYEYFSKHNSRIQKGFTELSNRLSMYNPNVSNGFIKVEDGSFQKIEIIAKDLEGNAQKLVIPLKGKKMEKIISKKEQKTPFWINRNEINKISEGMVQVEFPESTFYDSFYLDFNVKDSVAFIHKPVVPLNKSYTLTFDVSKYSKEQKKEMYIAHINKKGNSGYSTTIKKENAFSTKTKNLGKFTLLRDSISPKVVLHNIKNEQWITNFNYLKVRISDGESGIKSYRGEIDGEWILMEYEPKKNMLTYNLNDKSFDTAEHNLKVEVTDNVGNKTTLNATFYRKK